MSVDVGIGVSVGVGGSFGPSISGIEVDLGGIRLVDGISVGANAEDEASSAVGFSCGVCSADVARTIILVGVSSAAGRPLVDCLEMVQADKINMKPKKTVFLM